jgi:hypothetical protein
VRGVRQASQNRGAVSRGEKKGAFGNELTKRMRSSRTLPAGRHGGCGGLPQGRLMSLKHRASGDRITVRSTTRATAITTVRKHLSGSTASFEKDDQTRC